MNRGDLTNEQWERLIALLPPQKPTTGRPAHDHRPILNGIRWILRTGAPWRDLPDRYGPWRTVASRFYRWRKMGIFQRVLDALHQQADGQGQRNWPLHSSARTVIRAHQHAAGAKKGTQRSKREGAAREVSAPRASSAPRATASR
jgi:transposase